MVKLIRLCVFLCLYPVWIYAQDKIQYAYLLIDSTLRENADAVIRYEESTYVISSAREYSRYFTKAVTILNEDSPEAYAIVRYDQYSDADLQSISIYDAFGMLVRKVKRSEFEEGAAYSNINFLQDERLIGYRSFGGKIPYTLEYTWKINFHETLFYPAWQPQQLNVSIENAKFVLDAPSDLIIDIKTLNADFQYQKSESNGRRIETWELSHLPAIDAEEHMAADHKIFPLILLAPETFQAGTYKGSMRNWNSFGSFLFTLNKDREKMPESMVTLIHDITSECKNTREKIDTLYHWLQKNMRYVSVQFGIGGFQSFDAAYVEKNRFGDCKALSTFMKGMLQEVGIESWQTVIKGDEHENLFFEDFVVNDFNHMMLHIPSENLWLECTSNDLPTGMIGPSTQGKHVLFLTPTGGVTAISPKSNPEENIVSTIDSVFIGEKTEVFTTEVFHGNMQSGIRYLYYDLPPDEQRKQILERSSLPVMTLDKVNIEIDLTGERSVLETKKTLLQFGTNSGNRYFLPVNGLQNPNKSCGDQHLRKNNFVTYDDYTEVNDIYIRIPEDYTIEFLPPGTSLEAFGNTFALEIKLENQFIHVHQQLRNVPMQLSPEQHQELCRFYNNMHKAMNQKIVLKKLKQ